MFFLLALTLFPSLSTDVPNKQPQLASSGDTVAIVYGAGTSIYFAKSGDQGEHFSKPVKIADLPKLMLGRHRGPRVAFAGKTLVVSAISSESGDLRLWRSTDGGASWSDPVSVNDVPTAAREGLHALSADADGNVSLVWLDLRSKGTRLYGAVSKDAGKTFSKNFAVYESPDGTICQCCHPSLLSLGKAEFAVMFRNALAGNRDMYVTRIRDGAVVGKAENAGVGNWKLEACPMDGGGIGMSDGKLVTSWRRDKEIFLARQGSAEEKIGTGKDVALAVAGKKVFAVWNDMGRIVSNTAGELSKEGAFPSAVALSDGSALVAWEESGGLAVRRLR